MAAAFIDCKDTSCFESTAKALAARFVVSGSVAQLGEQFVLSLSMFDVVRASPAGRAEVKASSIENLYKQVPEAVDVLLEKQLGKRRS
jgi:hypothetical protein